jgi:hypothetical protein
MPSSGENVRFQLLVNGDAIGTGGVETTGVVSITVSWVRRDPDTIPDEYKSDPDFDLQSWVDNEIEVRLGGLDTVREEHVEWARYTAQLGDEITVRILPPGPFDEPTERNVRGTNGGCGAPDKTASRKRRKRGKRVPKSGQEPA